MTRATRTTAACTFLLLASCATHQASAQLTPAEDATVRRTYARLAMATELATIEISTAALKPGPFDRDLAAKAVSFKVLSIEGGAIATSVRDSRLNELVTLSGDTLDASVSSTRSRENGVTTVEEGAVATWKDAESGPDGTDNVTLGVFLPQSQFPTATRYARVEMQVSLAGRTRQYHCIFLFDPHGKTFAVDSITGMNVVNYFIDHPVYPHVLLGSRYRHDQPAVQTWLGAHQMEGCTPDGKECCDLPTLRCGVTREDIQRSNLKFST